MNDRPNEIHVAQGETVELPEGCAAFTLDGIERHTQGDEPPVNRARLRLHYAAAAPAERAARPRSGRQRT